MEGLTLCGINCNDYYYASVYVEIDSVPRSQVEEWQLPCP